jgi:hypothetical protein
MAVILLFMFLVVVLRDCRFIGWVWGRFARDPGSAGMRLGFWVLFAFYFLVQSGYMVDQA